MSRKPPNLHIVSNDGTMSEGALKELRDAVERMKRARHLMYEFNKEQAIWVRNEYQEYIRAGFKPGEALKLVAAKLGPNSK